MTEHDDRAFWTNLGIQIGQTLECSKQVKEQLDTFINNEFAHLQAKVDEVVKKVAYIVGVGAALWIAIQIAIKLIKL
jgi:hypothetical protein